MYGCCLISTWGEQQKSPFSSHAFKTPLKYVPLLLVFSAASGADWDGIGSEQNGFNLTPGQLVSIRARLWGLSQTHLDQPRDTTSECASEAEKNATELRFPPERDREKRSTERDELQIT